MQVDHFFHIQNSRLLCCGIVNIRAVAAMLPIMEKRSAILKSEYVNTFIHRF